jgi:hypothetical protein
MSIYCARSCKCRSLGQTQRFSVPLISRQSFIKSEQANFFEEEEAIFLFYSILIDFRAKRQKWWKWGGLSAGPKMLFYQQSAAPATPFLYYLWGNVKCGMRGGSRWDRGNVEGDRRWELAQLKKGSWKMKGPKGNHRWPVGRWSRREEKKCGRDENLCILVRDRCVNKWNEEIGRLRIRHYSIFPVGRGLMDPLPKMGIN